VTKKSIKKAFATAILAFGGLIVVGVLISALDSTKERVVFGTFKDLTPLFLGIAAAWLGYCVQRRHSYKQQLRTLWSKLVEAVQQALQYTHLSKPTEDQFSSVLTNLSIAIDEVRGVFKNLSETDGYGGLYPFEPIKDIFGLIEELGYGADFNPSNAATCRKKIFELWKDVRKEILKEFDREAPTFSHSHWADVDKGRVYDKHGIPKRPT